MSSTGELARSNAASRRELTEIAFQSLLKALAPDREEAAAHYELIRKKLIRLFAWRGFDEPEELADDTLNRVAAKLAAGLKIESSDPYRYFSAVAYRIFQERIRFESRRRQQLHDYGLETSRQLSLKRHASETESSRLEICFKHCLGSASAQERNLVLRYYDGEKSARIRKRKAMAVELGLELNNLRVRSHRIRQRLEKCTRDCVARSGGDHV